MTFTALNAQNAKAGDFATVDVVIVGSGAAGLTAAVILADAGLDVLVLEKTPYFGGTTACSGGGLWIPCNHYMREAGISDSREEAETYLRSLLGNYYDEKKIGAFLANSATMVEYMVARSEVRFESLPIPDYEPATPGSKMFRSIIASAYDGRRLGRLFKKLRPPLPQLGVFGMQVHFSDVPRLRAAHKSLSDFAFAAKLLVQAAISRTTHDRSTRLTNGNALAGQLLKSASNLGVQLWSQADVKDLEVSDGLVGGVLVDVKGETRKIVARRAVILASGGFGANPEMRREHVELAEHGYSLQPEGCNGDGIKFGIAVGGQLQTDNIANAIGTPVSTMRRLDGSLAVSPDKMMERFRPGSLIVNIAGKRFVNEACHYQRFLGTMQAKKVKEAFLIAGHPFVRKYGIGMAPPAPLSLRSYLRSGHIVKADNLEELAKKLAIQPDILVDTVERFNRDARQGVDPEFSRHDDPYSQFFGDPANRPNPSLGPVEGAPFYALRLYPGDYSTIAGLETNETAQVVDASGKVIQGLYALGIDMNSVFRGAYPGAGASIGPLMTFAYIAAKHIAQKEASTRGETAVAIPGSKG